MKNKLKNGALLAILASAMIACNGGSTNNSQTQVPNLQLPQPEVLDDSVAGAAAKTAPFLGALGGFVKEFIPGATGILSITQFGVGLVNLLEPSIGFAQVMTKLNGIENQLSQLQNQVTVELGLTEDTLSKVDQTYLTLARSNLQSTTKQIYEAHKDISDQYIQYHNEKVFGNVSYLDPIGDMYRYASAHCESKDILGILENSTQKIGASNSAITFYGSFIGSSATYWNTLSARRSSYLAAMTPYFESAGASGHVDMALFFNYYNQDTFNLAGMLYATWDELRLMQLADAAYYYACPGKAVNLTGDSFSNVGSAPSPLSESSTQNYGQYEQLAEQIYTYYNSNFSNSSSTGLKDLVQTTLQPFTNAEITNTVNSMFQGSGNTVLESATFASAGLVNSVPANANSCSVVSFDIESNGFVYVTANCFVESNNLEFSYRTISHKVPYSLNGTGTQITSTYGFNNLYFESNQPFLMSRTTNLSVPVSSGNSSYLNTGSAVELSYANDAGGDGSPTSNVIVNVESSIYVYASPWSNVTTSNCTYSNGARNFLSCGGAGYLANLVTNGYGKTFSITPMTQQTLNVVASQSGNSTAQVYYAASYKGHLFYIQYLMAGYYPDNGVYRVGSNAWQMYSGQLYASLVCMTSDCTAVPSSAMQQLTWGDGTVIQLNNSSSDYGNANIQVTSSSSRNSLVTRKLFQFESDNLFAAWESNPKHLHHLAYLNGRIKYTLNTGAESVPIFVSRNYNYRLAYIPNGNSGSLQIQSNNNDGTWNTESTLATAPNGATDLYLNYGDVLLVNSVANTESVIWSVSQQYRSNNVFWAGNIYAQVVLTNQGQLNIYAWDANNQAGVRGTSPDDANYTRMLWSSSNFPWTSVNHGTLLQPIGSYTQSCSSISWASPNLTASCLTAAGNNSTTTTLNYTTCSGNSTVSNINGVLTCDTPNKSRPS